MDLNEVANDLDADHQAHEEIMQLCRDWTASAWDEIDWYRVKDMSVREIHDKRRAAAATAQDAHCLECPNFVKHVSIVLIITVCDYPVVDGGQFGMRHDEWLIKENIAQLRQLMSDQNLQLLPDYEQRIMVLKDLGFVDDNARVELKGKVACEV